MLKEKTTLVEDIEKLRELVGMYKYIYVNAETDGLFSEANHREIIEQYSKDGWRFVTAIPTAFSGHGVIKSF